MRATNVLRAMLMGLLLVLILACGLLLIVSLDLAADYPQADRLRVPIFAAVLVGLLPVVAAVRVLGQFMGLVDRGEAFSQSTVDRLRLLKRLAASVAVYLLVGFAVVWVALLPDESPSVFLAWLSAEIVVVFLMALFAVFERLFVAALELRHDNELTV